jgi:hypothetical protein
MASSIGRHETEEKLSAEELEAVDFAASGLSARNVRRSEARAYDRYFASLL